MFATAGHVHPNLVFAGKAGDYLNGDTDLTLMVGPQPCPHRVEVPISGKQL
jgi:hypothetical protein